MKEMSEKLIGLIDTVYICVHSTHITSSDTQSEEPTVTATQYTHSHYTAYLDWVCLGSVLQFTFSNFSFLPYCLLFALDVDLFQGRHKS